MSTVGNVQIHVHLQEYKEPGANYSIGVKNDTDSSFYMHFRQQWTCDFLSQSHPDILAMKHLNQVTWNFLVKYGDRVKKEENAG